MISVLAVVPAGTAADAAWLEAASGGAAGGPGGGSGGKGGAFSVTKLSGLRLRKVVTWHVAVRADDARAADAAVVGGGGDRLLLLRLLRVGMQTSQLPMSSLKLTVTVRVGFGRLRYG
eukprot:scaffold9655_cov45-Phaeocystis_antarctica.AAC.2